MTRLPLSLLSPSLGSMACPTRSMAMTAALTKLHPSTITEDAVRHPLRIHKNSGYSSVANANSKCLRSSRFSTACSDSKFTSSALPTLAHASLLHPSVHSSVLIDQRRSVIAKGPMPDIEVPNEDLFSFVKRHFLRFPDDELYADGPTGVTWTAKAVIDGAEKIASGLAKRGFKQGDVAGVFSTNCPEYPVVCLAVLALGGVVTPANTSFIASELALQLRASSSKVLISSPNLLPVAEEAFQLQRVEEGSVLQDLFFIGDESSSGSSTATSPSSPSPAHPLSTLLNDDGANFSVPPSIDAADAVAFLPYSSGTTGLPKGVMLTHRNLVANQVQMFDPLFTTALPGESSLGLLPFYHIYGLSVLVFSLPLHRSRVVTLPAFEPVSFLSAVQKYKMTVMHLVPPLVIFFAKHPLVDQFDLTSVRTILSGAAPLGKDTEAAFSARTGIVDVRQGYGLSETSPMISMSPKGMDKMHSGTAGTFPAITEIKVMDLDSGKELDFDQVGEICIRGPQVMKGYLNNERATKECIDEDNWFHTGDIGYVSKYGFLYVTDRLKELIKYKGHQVAPAQLEALLLTHESVADVAVIGVPAAEDVGELPKAFVVLKAGVEGVVAENLESFVAERVSPHSKLRGGVVFVEAIPKSAAGKILRRVLKTM